MVLKGHGAETAWVCRGVWELGVGTAANICSYVTVFVLVDMGLHV